MNDLKPLALGEIIDRGVTMWRKSWLRLFQLSFGFALLQYALVKAVELSGSHFFPLLANGGRLARALESAPAQAAAQLGMAVATGAAAVVVLLYVQGLSAIACTHYLQTEPSGTLAAAFAHARQRAGTAAGTFTLVLGWAVVVAVLLCLPGAALIAAGAIFRDSTTGVGLLVAGFLLLGLGALAWVLWLVLRLMLIAQVVCVEDGGALQSFRRSNELISGRIEPGFFGLVKVRLAVLVTVTGLVLFIVSSFTGLPAIALKVVYGNAFDPMHANPDAVPQFLLVPAELLNTLCTSLVAPFQVAVNLFFYLDMRNRREGLDLMLKLESTPAPTVNAP